MEFVSFAVWVSLLRSIWFFLTTGVLKLNFLVRSLILSFISCSLAWLLMYILFVCDRVPGVRSVLLRVSRFHGSSARQVTLWSYFSSPSFIALDKSSNSCMIRIWLICGFWEVDEVVPITSFIYQTFGSYFYVCLYCYAMLVDVDWVWVNSSWQMWDY